MENENQKIRMKVRCPKCGYVMPISFDADAECKGIWVSCKGRNCKTVFEVKIKEGQQYR